MPKEINISGLNRLSPLNPHERDLWVTIIAQNIKEKWTSKYLLGAIQHQSDLGEIPLMMLLDEMENEALDQLSYIYELKRRLQNSSVSTKTNADISSSSTHSAVGSESRLSSETPHTQTPEMPV